MSKGVSTYLFLFNGKRRHLSRRRRQPKREEDNCITNNFQSTVRQGKDQHGPLLRRTSLVPKKNRSVDSFPLGSFPGRIVLRYSACKRLAAGLEARYEAAEVWRVLTRFGQADRH